uniref:ATP synthase F0 subunit 6 n=1 Tax=Sphyranura euryceae TaxID=2996394 RepID=A0AA51UAH2_9PLAT|nr:ATP synthase F0 subunit 6 [Sphyranura euryceae]WMV02085.1 ATP synthase F0 subunit 6 [Sphyranura euryceae]
MLNRFSVFFNLFLNSQSFFYSYFTIGCLFILLVSQFPYIWSFAIIYAIIPFLVGLRSLGIAIYNLINFLKIIIISFPSGLPSIWFSILVAPFIFIGECSSQMLRPVTLILRLLVNLSFAYMVTLTLGSQFAESIIYWNFSFFFSFIFLFSIFYFFYEVFMCFLLTYVSHVMMLSLISDMHHILSIKFL